MVSCRKFSKKYFYTLAILIFSSCATMKGSHERVKIISRPPGATVVIDGQQVGITPEFVTVTRHPKVDLQLLSNGEIRNLQLKGEYRWRESFIPNFIFLIFAPVGWGIDLLSGAAWEYPSLGFVNFKLTSADAKKNRTVLIRRIAIAPPQASRELLSDELGAWLEKSARARYVTDQVIDFDRTSTTFRDFEYTYDDPSPSFLLDQLADATSATHFLESKVVNVDENQVTLNVSLRNAYTDEVEEEYHLTVQGQAVDFNQHRPIVQSLLSALSILPNNGSIDTATPRSNFAVDGPSASAARYASESDKNPNFFSYMTSIGLGNVRSPRPVTRTSVHFRFLPHIALTYDRFHMNAATDDNEIKGITYGWYNLFFGLGPEGSIETTIGNFYLQILPCVGYNWVYWNQGPLDKASYKADVQLEAEFGWQFFITNRFNFKFFSRTLSASASQWSDVFAQSLGRSAPVYTQQQISSGIAIGYYFPEGREAVKSIFR